MKYPAFVRAAAVALTGAVVAGGALALQPQNEPAVMTDVGPLPAQMRGSIGAVILMEEPVLAQREMMQRALARHEDALDTRRMGAGPARALERGLRNAFEREQGREPRERRGD